MLGKPLTSIFGTRIEEPTSNYPILIPANKIKDTTSKSLSFSYLSCLQLVNLLLTLCPPPSVTMKTSCVRFCSPKPFTLSPR